MSGFNVGVAAAFGVGAFGLAAANNIISDSPPSGRMVSAGLGALSLSAGILGRSPNFAAIGAGIVLGSIASMPIQSLMDAIRGVDETGVKVKVGNQQEQIGDQNDAVTIEIEPLDEDGTSGDNVEIEVDTKDQDGDGDEEVVVEIDPEGTGPSDEGVEITVDGDD